MSYNGYPNWATWNVQLWLNNDEGLYRAYQSILRRADPDAIDGDFVEAVVLDIMPNGTPDFKGNARRYIEVDWEHLAEFWAEEAREYAA